MMCVSVNAWVSLRDMRIPSLKRALMGVPCVGADGRVSRPCLALRAILAVRLPCDPIRLPMTVTLVRWERKGRRGGSCVAFVT